MFMSICLLQGNYGKLETSYWLRRRRIVAKPSRYDFSLVKTTQNVFIVFSPREMIYPHIHVLTFILLFSVLWGMRKE
jgi:hypothetical protein